MSRHAPPASFRWKDYLLVGLEWYRQRLDHPNFDFLAIPSNLKEMLKTEKPQLVGQKTEKFNELVERISFGRMYYGVMHLIRKRFNIPPGPGLHYRVQKFLYNNLPLIAGRVGVLRRMREWADYYDRKPLWEYLNVTETGVYSYINSELSSLLRWLSDHQILT